MSISDDTVGMLLKIPCILVVELLTLSLLTLLGRMLKKLLTVCLLAVWGFIKAFFISILVHIEGGTLK